MAGHNGRWASSLAVIREAVRRFGAANGSLMAAAISFYVLLSLLPLLLLGVSVLGYVVGSSESAFRTVTETFSRFAPTSTFIVDALRGLVQIRGVIGWVGLVSLLWTSSQLFVTLQTALDTVWEASRRPGLIRARVKAVVLVFVVGIFLVISLAATSVSAYLRSTGASAAGIGHGVVSVVVDALAIAVAVASSVTMFTIVYRVVPDVRTSWGSAFVGGLFAGVVWAGAKELYRLYLMYVADFDRLYGSLGGVIILVLWIYYSSMILVFGAELSYARQHGAET